MTYSSQEISEITGGELLGNEDGTAIQHIVFDSRAISNPEQSMFLALEGNRRDGHQFLDAAYKEGIRHFMISKEIPVTNFPGAAFIKVADVLKSLQKWAQLHRKRFSLPVIGITGSNGKTIVKEWLSSLLTEHYSITKSPKSYNSQLGVPISVLMLQKEHELAIFEAGVSRSGEMSVLSNIIDCTIGILTNIADAHDAGFPTREEKIKEKLSLFSKSKKLIYQKENPQVDHAITLTLPKIELISWSTSHHLNPTYLVEISPLGDFSHVVISSDSKSYSFDCKFQDKVALDNLCHCLVAVLELHLNPMEIQDEIFNLRSVPLRSELLQGENQNLLINDSYNFDLFSLTSALDLLTHQAGDKTKMLIISDLKGQQVKNQYQQIARLIRQHKISKVFAVGHSIRQLQSHLDEQVIFRIYDSTEQLLRYLDSHLIQNHAILIKGARSFSFEKICQKMLDLKHQTALEINLSALDHNISEYSKFLEARTKIMAIIKASAYGSGSHELARKLQSLKVDYLAVAYIDEGIYLRKNGIMLPILVLNPDPKEIASLIEFQLEAEVYSLDQLKKMLVHLDQASEFPRLHIKLDSGMHRLGFEQAQLAELCQIIQSHQLDIVSIFSHISAGDDPSKDRETLRQFDLFHSLYQFISTEIGVQPMRHILNSAGIVRFPQFQFDMVRMGIGMYGIDPSGLIQSKLKKVHRLKTSISQVKYVPAGESVGYGRKFKLDEGKWIGTINIGYADGLLRAFGNGLAEFYIAGKQYPTIGDICMDMTLLDLGAQSLDFLQQEVEIFGEFVDILQLANKVNTIPYELLSRISSRVKRIYTED